MSVARIDPFWNDVISAVDFVGNFTHLEKVLIQRSGRQASVQLDSGTNVIRVLIADGPIHTPPVQQLSTEGSLNTTDTNNEGK